MRIPFRKMHGAANDFVVIDHRAPCLAGPLALLARRLCDRRRGVGADGLLLLERDPELDFAMRYLNADGSDAEFCGNGARCLARLALDLGLGRGGMVRFRTAAGIMSARAAGGSGIELRFGRVERGAPLTVEAGGRAFAGLLVAPGVPHFVVGVDRVEQVPLPEWAPALRGHARFGPQGANVDFVARLGPSRVAMRTWERGVEAETPACGSGAIASALWAAAAGEPSPVVVRTAGGDDLVVSFEESAGAFEVALTGPAETAFRGEWEEPAAAGVDSGRGL
jgi:diaminopimelate epimerase